MSTFTRDLVERTLSTYAQVFLGLLIADGVDLTNVSTLRAAAVSAIPAALAVIKGGLARKFGEPDNASLAF